MNGNDNVFLAIVVIVAFSIGYLFVSAVFKKLKPPERAEDPLDLARGEDSFQKFGGREQFNRARNSYEEEQYHAAILGLRHNYTLSEITKAYHDKLSKYHPDKLKNIGDDFKAIADERRRLINASYEFFRQKYGIK